LIDEMLAEGYSLHVGDKPHEYVVEGFKARHRPTPVLLRVEPTAVAQYIARMASSAEALYPDLEPMEAGYRLTTIHLDEELDATLPPLQEISFEGDGIRTVPVEAWVDALTDVPPGDHRWTTTRPDPDGFVRETDPRRRH
jgi:hypothetical protein